MKRPPFLGELGLLIGLMPVAVVIFLAVTHVLNPDTQDRWKARRLQKRVTPPAGRIVTEADPAGWSSPRYSWDIETELTWPAYCQWVSERLSPDFHVVAHTDSSMELARERRQDGLYLVRLLRTSPLQVRITLRNVDTNNVYP